LKSAFEKGKFKIEKVLPLIMKTGVENIDEKFE
jgi:hypothetical protein